MANIVTKVGSATDPRPDSNTGRGVVVSHLCNDAGRWGKGFVLAVNDLCPAPKAAYQGLASAFKSEGTLIPHGTTQLVETHIGGLFVANIVAQRMKNSNDPDNVCLVDYQALQDGLTEVFIQAARLNCDIHIPSGIGAGLAGGIQSIIHGLIQKAADAAEQETLPSHPVNITLWDYQDTTSDSYIAVGGDDRSGDENDPIDVDDDDDDSDSDDD